MGRSQRYFILSLCGLLPSFYSGRLLAQERAEQPEQSAAGFCDTFDDGNANGWTPRNASSWTVEQDQIATSYFLKTTVTPPEGRLGQYSIYNGFSATNFNFNCRARSTENFAAEQFPDIALVYEFSDDLNYSFVQYNRNKDFTTISKVVNGTSTILAASSGAVPVVQDNDYHGLRVSRSGNQVEVYYDGNLVMTGTDPNPVSGKFGVGSFNDRAYFDEVNIGNSCTPRSDLDVTTVTVPSSANAGESITVTNTVKNLESISAAAFRVGIYLSSDNNIELSDEFLGSRNVNSLAGNGTSTGNTSITIPAGTSAGTYYIGVFADDQGQVGEENENNNTGSASIVIDDVGSQADLSINDATVTEGNSGIKNAIFTVSLSEASGQTVTVNYQTANGSATAGSDYVTKSGTLTFVAGTTTQQITIQVNGDLIDEADETFYVNLSNAANATITDGQGQGTIIDDDDAPSISIDDVVVSEGNAGTRNAIFTVSLSAASSQTVTVSYQTADGSATAGSDYTTKSGILTFSAGTTTQQVNIVVNGDVADEADETFFVNLSNATNATIMDAQGQGAIFDDDEAPSFSISDVTVTEGNAGTTNASFAVNLSTASNQTVTVNYQTADGSATAGSDYVTKSGTLTFNAGTTTQQITIQVNGDLIDEADETFFVNLSNASNATIADAQAQGTIIDDDGAPSLSISDVGVTESNAGTTDAVFTVSLSPMSNQTVTVNYQAADGSATAGSDYVTKSGTLTFNAGTTTQQITIQINGDLVDEADETFFVNLSNATNATIADAQGQGTIIDDDGAPSISINDVIVAEGNTATSNAIFTVGLSAASNQTVTVNYQTMDGTATAGSDYVAKSGTLTFAAGTTSQSITILVNGDVIDEADEMFFVNLSSSSNATITDAQGQGTIIDDDGVSVSISDVTVLEANTGTAKAVFAVSLSAVSSQAVTVSFETMDGSATASDYVTKFGALTFTAGTMQQQIEVTVNGDVIDEADETFFVNLSNAINATIADAQAQGTIIDNDEAPSLSIGDVTVAEGNAGTTSANFTVSLSTASGKTVTVNYQTADGTATAGSDYVAKSGTLSFLAGTTQQQIGVEVIGDVIDEGDETFFVNLSNATNATIADAQGQGTITDDDVASLSINDMEVGEGDVGAVNAIFTVSLSTASTQTITVNYQTADGTATAGSDYVPKSGILSFAAGETMQPITVVVSGDMIDEADETFFVNLSNATNASIVDAQGQGTIVDDDVVIDPPQITHTSPPLPQAAGVPRLIQANVTDVDGIASVELYFRQGGSVNFDSLAMSKAGDTYSETIPGPFITSRGAEYFMRATDNANVTTQSPLYPIQVIISSLTKPTPQPSGTAQTSYRLISVPFNLDIQNAGSIAVLEDDLGPYDNTEWRLFAINNGVLPYVEFSASGIFTSGRSFFLIVADPNKVVDAGPGQSLKTNEEYQITLATGHNFVASPFNFSIPASKLRLASGLNINLWTYDGGWVAATEMSPWEGYYIANNSAADVLFVDPNLSSGSASTEAASKIASQNWRLQITATCEEARDTENFAGVAQHGNDGWDDADQVEPPPIGEYVSLYFPHPEWEKPLSRYSDDIRSPQNENQRWDFIVESTLAGEMVNLRFDNIQTLDGEMSVFLIDDELDYKQNLRERGAYQFQSRGPERPKKLLLVVGQQDYITDATEGLASVPEDYTLYQNFPNPFNPETAIRFGLPEKSVVTLKIFDISGREVAILLDHETFDSGLYQRYWNGRDAFGRPVSSGIYFYKLIAGRFLKVMKMAFVK